jgi:hypothetical protein
LRLCAFARKKKSTAADLQIFCFPKGLSALFYLIDPREKKIIFGLGG